MYKLDIEFRNVRLLFLTTSTNKVYLTKAKWVHSMQSSKAWGLSDVISGYVVIKVLLEVGTLK